MARVMASGREGVAESCFNFLHMEMVQMALGASASAANPSSSDILHAGRQLESVGFQVCREIRWLASPKQQNAVPFAHVASVRSARRWVSV